MEKKKSDYAIRKERKARQEAAQQNAGLVWVQHPQHPRASAGAQEMLTNANEVLVVGGAPMVPTSPVVLATAVAKQEEPVVKQLAPTTPAPVSMPVEPGQYGWHSVRGEPYRLGWRSVVNLEASMVRLVWDMGDPDEAAMMLGRETVCYLSEVESSQAKPSARQGLLLRGPNKTKRIGQDADADEKRQKELEPACRMNRRFSMQLYGSYPTDTGALSDLRDERCHWRGKDGSTAAEHVEAECLMGECYLAKQPAHEDSGAEAAWQLLLSSMQQVPSCVGEAEVRPRSLAAAGVRAAPFVQGDDDSLSVTPYVEGKHFNGYPAGVIAESAKRGVDLLQHGNDVTAEAAVAAIHLAGGRIERVPNAADIRIRPDVDATVYAPVHSRALSSMMAEAADKIEDFLDEESLGSDEKWYTNFERLRFGVKDDCTEASIYAGCCGGFKRQPPLSKVIGQYNTHQIPKAFTFDSQIALKRRLMIMVNAYVRLAEAEAEQLMPEEFKKQARLRAILAQHPAFRQTHGIEEWFRKGTDETYVGCGLVSQIFTNCYISIGSRTRPMHTDWRNPCITHLTTRLRGDWSGQEITGQTVLFDRHATRAIVVDDSTRGRVLVGGLNAFKHANMGPNGDIQCGPRC